MHPEARQRGDKSNDLHLTVDAQIRGIGPRWKLVYFSCPVPGEVDPVTEAMTLQPPASCGEVLKSLKSKHFH